MIECPFCGESFEEEDLVFEFNWGDVATYFHNRKQIDEPKSEFRDRPFYVTMRYDHRGNPLLNTMSPVINPERHHGYATDPMRSAENGWPKVERLLREKRMFEVEADDNDHTLPVSAKILPLIKHSRRTRGRNTVAAEGLSTGMYCPICEQQLRADVLNSKAEVRIVLVGRPGSGKTVYITQAINDLLSGKLTHAFTIEAANSSVHEHYISNNNRMKPFGKGFVLATNPGVVQDPYIFLLSNNKTSFRLVIQDIAGEDCENHIKYSKAVRKADMLLFFVDPWHIEEIRTQHKRNNDPSNAIVEETTRGQYDDLSGIFHKMTKVVDRKFTEESDQLAGVMLIKGDYLIPSMLADDEAPEYEMMRQNIPYSNLDSMEFSIGMRSSFIRQCIFEWNSTRTFANEVEGKYSSHNTRYFVASALGQSTHLRRAKPESEVSVFDTPDSDDPNAQFNIGGSSHSSEPEEDWNYGEQVLEAPAAPKHVIDPIVWCLKRKGIKF